MHVYIKSYKMTLSCLNSNFKQTKKSVILIGSNSQTKTVLNSSELSKIALLVVIFTPSVKLIFWSKHEEVMFLINKMNKEAQSTSVCWIVAEAVKFGTNIPSDLFCYLIHHYHNESPSNRIRVGSPERDHA